jgi:hypothetical protein
MTTAPTGLNTDAAYAAQGRDRDAELARVRAVVADCGYNKPGYRLLVEVDKADDLGRVYMQVECDRPDTFTGRPGVGRGGKAYLSPYMTQSELVRRAFGLFLAYEEHECREAFTWKEKRVFGPHIAVESLWEVADEIDVRPPQ